MLSLSRAAFIFVALLASSLYSYTAYVQMAGIILLGLICLCYRNVRRDLITRDTLLLFALSTGAITACYFYFLLFPNPVGAPELEKSALNNFIFLILVVCFLFFLASLIRTELVQVTFALACLLVLNDLILFLQTVYLAVSQTYIDFVEPVTGEASRYHNYENLNPVFAFRPTGLYVEPSTFSAAVAAMAIGYVVLCRRQKRQPHMWLLLMTVVAMLITQSTAATIQCLILLSAVLLTQKKSMLIFGAAVCGVLLVSAPTLLDAYYGAFMLKMGESSTIRISLLDFIYHTRRGWDLVFGFGPFDLEESLYHMANAGGQYQVASLNDAGLLQYFVVRFGLVGLLFPLAMLLRVRRDITSLLFLALLLSSKLSYAFPVIYLGLLPLLMRVPVQALSSARLNHRVSGNVGQPGSGAR